MEAGHPYSWELLGWLEHSEDVQNSRMLILPSWNPAMQNSQNTRSAEVSTFINDDRLWLKQISPGGGREFGLKML